MMLNSARKMVMKWSQASKRKRKEVKMTRRRKTKINRSRRSHLEAASSALRKS